MKNRKSIRKWMKCAINKVIDFSVEKNYHNYITKLGGNNNEKKVVLYFNVNNTFIK